MAALTVATKEAPFDSGRDDLSVVVKTVTGTGTDATEVAAVVSASQHVLLDGFICHDGAAAETLDILSNTTVIARVALPNAAGTIDLAPFRGAYTVGGEALKLNKSGTVSNITASEFHYVTLTDGQYYPNLT